MVHRFDCPLCAKPVTAETHMAGTRVKCPHCREEFTVPAASGGAIPPPPTAAPPPPTRLSPSPRRRCAPALEAHGALPGHLARSPPGGALSPTPRAARRTGLPTGPAIVADDGELPTPMHAYAAAGAKA